jgi:hypothetical protein
LARFHLKLLEGQPTRKRLISALDRLPTELNGTYEKTLDRILEQPEEYANIAMRALKWITFAKDFLWPDALQHALSVGSESADIDKDDLIEISKLISICAGLVIWDSEVGSVHLFHYSTHEFLRRRLEQDGNSEIAKTCLQYLSFPGFSNLLPQLDSVISWLDTYKLGWYATRYWSDHVRGPSEDQFHDAILKTFENPGSRTVVAQMLHLLPPSDSEPTLSLFLFACMSGLPSLCKKLLEGGIHHKLA